MTLHSPRRRSGTVTERFEADASGEVVVLFDPATSMVRGLSQTATFLWDHLDGRHTAPQLAQLVAAEFAIDESTALRDVERFVDELTAADLLEELPGTGDQ